VTVADIVFVAVVGVAVAVVVAVDGVETSVGEKQRQAPMFGPKSVKCRICWTEAEAHLV